MKLSVSYHFFLTGLCAALSVSGATNNEINWAEAATVSASSQRSGYEKEKVNDSVVSDASRWLAAEGDSSPWIELSFAGPTTIGRIDVFSGWRDGSALADYQISLQVDGTWQSKPEWEILGNQETVKRIYLDETQVTGLRVELLTASPGRIREIAVYDNQEAIGLPNAFPDGTAADNPVAIVDYGQHQIILNQVGYLTDRPKRFTAPLSADGAVFKIRTQDQAEIHYQGVVSGGLGDFTEFKPADSDARYVIDLSGGALTSNTSDPFLIRQNLAQEQYWQTATDFLNDVRSVVGTHPSAFGGCAFRDGTYYDAIIPSLVLFYLSDPEFIESMPRQIDWQADKDRVTAPDFEYIQDGAQAGVMDAVYYYYDLDPPAADAPDVVKLIHWGAGYILKRPNGRDPRASFDNDDSMIEPQTLEQVAYVLWAWPKLQQWLPQSFYDQCRDFCFKFWDPAGGPTGDFTQGGSGSKKGSSPLDISPWWYPDTYSPIDDWTANHMHPFKGRHAPGHSIVPNLMMYEVALREGRDDAAVYLNAAVNQADWMINNLDWNDPRTAKGHRLAEHRTIPNLVWMLQKYPQQAPDGLKAKIAEWAETAVARADNLWDFRKFNNDMWTIPGMNEVGNSLSLPAIYTAASWVVDDPALKERLEELAYASVDHVFGRNPMLAAASSHPHQGFPEIERGWPKLYKEDTCARLETVRGNLATLPGSEMYPFQPGAAFRHLEGWANYGASWCISLSYLQFDAQGTTPDPSSVGNPIPPAFTTDPIIKADAVENAAYSGSIADDATDPQGDPMSFSKVSGPAWLSVATNGVLSGTPGKHDSGTNSWTVSVSDGFISDTAMLNITVLRALPFEADFEGYASGQDIGGTNGWVGEGIVTALNYSATYTGAWPLPESSHSQVLDASSLSQTVGSDPAHSELWFDSVVQFHRVGDPASVEFPSNAKVWFVVDANQSLNVYHSVDQGASYANAWTVLDQTSISTSQWVRLTVDVSYTNAVQTRAFYRVYLDGGSALTSPAAYIDRADAAPASGGTWFLCANPAESGNPISELRLSEIRCDDLILTANAVIFQQTYLNWLDDEYPGLTETGRTDNPDGDALNNWQEYALGGNPGMADTGFVPIFQKGVSGLEYIHVQRKNASDLNYYLEASTNLVTGGWTNYPYTVSGTNTAFDTHYSEVTNQVPADLEAKFIRLMIEEK